MKLLFLIACKYYRNYKSYIEIYINNIQKFYDDVDILIVDNNSKHIEDIINIISKYKNVYLITNKSDNKYEIGAYRFGIKFMGEFINNYEYIIFSQDTYIINKKYDFNILKINDIKACPFTPDIKKYNDRYLSHPKGIEILNSVNLNNHLDEITFCFSNSFILHNSVINDFIKYTDTFKLLTKYDSGISEDFLARVLYELNNHKNYNIDNDYNYNKNMFEGNLNENIIVNDYYFVKILQRKNESTPDI